MTTVRIDRPVRCPGGTQLLPFGPVEDESGQDRVGDPTGCREVGDRQSQGGAGVLTDDGERLDAQRVDRPQQQTGVAGDVQGCGGGSESP